MDLDERRRLADANVTSAFDLARERSHDPRGGRARFGAVDVVALGAEVAFYNPVLALDPRSGPDDVVAAVEWVESKGLPASVQVRADIDREVHKSLEALGLVADPWHTPVMVLEPIPWSGAPGAGGPGSLAPGSLAPAPQGIEIRTGGDDLFDDMHAVLGSSATFRRIFGLEFLGDPAVRVVVGYLEGEPVSAATAIRSGSTLGIYAVATIERARRRGIGRAVTSVAIEAGRSAWDCTIAVLQSSEMGVPVYTSMGFVEVARYVSYERPTP